MFNKLIVTLFSMFAVASVGQAKDVSICAEFFYDTVTDNLIAFNATEEFNVGNETRAGVSCELTNDGATVVCEEGFYDRHMTNKVKLSIAKNDVMLEDDGRALVVKGALAAILSSKVSQDDIMNACEP